MARGCFKKTMPGFLVLKLLKDAWIGHHRIQTFANFENLCDVLEQALQSGPILPSEIQASGEKLKQHWTDLFPMIIQ